MTETYEQQQGNEEVWKAIFEVGHPDLLKQHWLHRKMPTKPRCRLCLVPFKGIGGWFMRRWGKAQNSRNPNFCNACDGFLEAFPGGAEVDMSILFVDIRHSTEYSDSNKPSDVSRRINTFLSEATAIITAQDGFIMAFYGDCIVAVWPPGFAGEEHAEKAQQAARKLAKSENMVDENGENIPLGVAVHSGNVFIGTVSALQGSFRDVSIFGQAVNLTARMASHASANQALASVENVTRSGRSSAGLNSERVLLKGLAEPVDLYTLV